MSTAPKQLRQTSPARRPAPRKTTPARPNLRVIPGGASQKAPRTVGPRAQAAVRAGRFPSFRFVAVSSLIVAAFVFGLVLLNVLVAQASFKLADLETQVRTEEDRYRRMRYEVAFKESPARVAEAAAQIGLVPPESQEYILGLPGRPSAEGMKELPGTNEQEMKAVLGGERYAARGSRERK